MSTSDPIEIGKAQELVRNDKIARIESVEFDNFFVVTGTNDDYLVVLPRFCTCERFLIKCLIVPGKACKHLLAVKMAKNIKTVSPVDWRDLLYRDH